jgi:hypothetical protein
MTVPHFLLVHMYGFVFLYHVEPDATTNTGPQLLWWGSR